MRPLPTRALVDARVCSLVPQLGLQSVLVPTPMCQSKFGLNLGCQLERPVQYSVVATFVATVGEAEAEAEVRPAGRSRGSSTGTESEASLAEGAAAPAVGGGRLKGRPRDQGGVQRRRAVRANRAEPRDQRANQESAKPSRTSLTSGAWHSTTLCHRLSGHPAHGAVAVGHIVAIAHLLALGPERARHQRRGDALDLRRVALGSWSDRRRDVP